MPIDPQMEALLQRYPVFQTMRMPWEEAGQTGEQWLLDRLHLLNTIPQFGSFDFGGGESANTDRTSELDAISGEALGQVVGGPLDPRWYHYTDPIAKAYADAAVYNANQKDSQSLLGDNFFQALAMLGAGVGAAGAFGAFGAFAAPAVAGVEGATAAGVGAGGYGGLASAGPVTLDAFGEAVPIIASGSGLGSAAAPVAAGGAGAAGLGGAGGAGAAEVGGVTGGVGGTLAGPTASGATLDVAGGAAAAGAAPATTGGVLGTGLTAGQLLRLAPLAIAGGSALAGALGGNGDGSSDEASLEENEALFERLRQLAADSIPERLPGIIETQRELTQRANASPATLTSDLRDQIGQLREQLQQRFSAAGKALGPAGGRQTEREQARVLATAGKGLQGLFQSSIAPAATNLTSFLSGIRPALSTALPQPVTQQGNLDFSSLATGIRGAGQLYRSNLFNPQPAPATNPAAQDPWPVLY